VSLVQRATGTERGRLLVRVLGFLAAAAVAVTILPACEKIDRNMWETPAYRPQEEPVRLPPEGSVPTKESERTPKPGTPEAAALKNPEKATESSLLAGKELFGIHCAPCHGVSGKGDGPVAKKFVPTPADISAAGRGAHPPDGDRFAVITHGQGGMPPFRSDLAAKERWQVVGYIKTLK
jgi:mono/diheme cytochrome c family protein